MSSPPRDSSPPPTATGCRARWTRSCTRTSWRRTSRRAPTAAGPALWGTPLFQHAKTAGYLYQAHLRAEVRDRLGLEWGPVVNGAADLLAVPEQVRAVFSQRRAEILERQAELEAQTGRPVGDAGREVLAHTTRERKQYGVETHTWREEQRARAGEHGLGEREIAAAIEEGRERRSIAARWGRRATCSRSTTASPARTA